MAVKLPASCKTASATIAAPTTSPLKTPPQPSTASPGPGRASALSVGVVGGSEKPRNSTYRSVAAQFEPDVFAFIAQLVLAQPGLRARAGATPFGHRGPQVGGRHRADETGLDDANAVGDDHDRHGVDVILAMQFRRGGVLDIDHGHLGA